MNHRLIRQLVDLGMVEMKPTGSWGLTRDGCDFLDQLDVLRELDDRPRAAPQSSPRRRARAGQRSEAAAPPDEATAGRDGASRATRGRKSEGSR